MNTTTVTTTRSKQLHERARSFLPMGVTGDGRYSSPYPIAFSKAKGKWLHDVDGNVYLDYHGGFGTAVLGYAHPDVDAAVQKAMQDIGAFVGVPHPYEEELAERLCSLIPFAERVALCGGGGSDAIYHAVRLARAATGRTKIVKIEGGYHGWHSDVGFSTRPSLSAAGDVEAPRAVPNSAGILPAVAAEVLVTTVNDEGSLRRLFADHGYDVAGLLIEPVVYSAGCILVDKSYLQLTRELCTQYGAVLIFDEVMSGFRAGLGGAGAQLGVAADLGAFGKAIANGYIISVVAGIASLMTQLAPEGPVFYSGTFNGHPLSVAASLTTLDLLQSQRVPEQLSKLGERLSIGVNRTIRELGVVATCQTFGSIWNVYFGTTSVRNYRDLARSSGPETERLNDTYRVYLRDQGIYMHKRHVNRCFISAAHDEADIDRTVAVVGEFLDAHRKELTS